MRCIILLQDICKRFDKASIHYDQVFDESAGKKPRWVRVGVDVDRHVIIPDLSLLPSAGAAGEQVVEDYVSALSAAASMDATWLLWELHILNLPTPSAAASAVLRAHHSLGDGASLGKTKNTRNCRGEEAAVGPGRGRRGPPRHRPRPLVAPSAGAAGERVVEDYVSALSAAASIDATRLLWELHILNLPTPSAAASAVLRAHHSLGDGASLTSLLLACTRRAGDPSALPSATPRPRPRHGLLLWLWSLLAMAWHTLVDAALFAAFLAD
uniref:Diacylglycerol O-acyltransferase n=1 Tax=Ananas comosus var. bracteatus TaxID=296719 RepID=A0A6V7QTA5_ANACO